MAFRQSLHSPSKQNEPMSMDIEPQADLNEEEPHNSPSPDNNAHASHENSDDERDASSDKEMEYSSDEDLALGTEILYGTVLKVLER